MLNFLLMIRYPLMSRKVGTVIHASVIRALLTIAVNSPELIFSFMVLKWQKIVLKMAIHLSKSMFSRRFFVDWVVVLTINLALDVAVFEDF